MKSFNPPARPAAVGPASPPPASPPPLERLGNPNLLFSDAPLGLGELRDADVDVQLRISELHTGARRIVTSPGISCSRVASSCSIRSAGHFLPAK